MPDDIKLPPRPEPDGFLTIRIIGRDVEVNAYRDSTLDEYARAAVEADRADARDQVERLDAENHALRQQVAALLREAHMWSKSCEAESQLVHKLSMYHPRLRVEYWTGQWWEPLQGQKLREVVGGLDAIPHVCAARGITETRGGGDAQA